MSVSSNMIGNLTILETLSTGLAGSNPVVIDQANVKYSLSGASYKVIHDSRTFSGSTYLLDLTDAPGTNVVSGDSDAVDATGLRLQQLIIRNLSVANTLQVEADATAGYDVFGASGLILLPAATSTVPSLVMTSCPENSTDVVAATNDEILFTGTSGQTFSFALIFG